MAKDDEINRIQEQYKLQEQIRKSIEDSTRSLESFNEAQKDIVERYKLMQQTQKQIVDLQKLGTKEALKEAEILKRQVSEMAELNKELGKTSHLLKTAAKDGLKKIEFGIGSILSKWFDFDEALRKTSAEMGLSIGKFNMMQKNISMAAVGAQEWGVSTEQLAQAQGAYSAELGRSVILSSDVLENMSSLGKATGLGVDGVASLSAQMEQFGLGAQQSVDFIFQMSKESEQMGLNSGKVIKKFQDNLGLLNKLNFNKGVKGLQAMAKFSERYKLDMNSVAAVADKVFRPEGAIEAAAQLQVLGGSLASLGDPFQLMYKARNAPEELAKSITKAATASATWDEATKEWKVNAYELDRMKEAASALNMDYGVLVETAKQGAKMNLFESLLGGKGTKEQREMISGMAQMIDGKAQVQVGFDEGGKGVFKELKNLSADEIAKLSEQRTTQQEAAKDATSIREQWSNVLNQLIVATFPLLQALQEWLKPSVDGMSSAVTTWVKGLVEFIQGNISWMKWVAAGILALKGLKMVFGPIFDMVGWFLRGRMLAKGFNSGTMTNPLGGQGGKTSVSSGAKDFLKNQKANAGGSPALPDGKNMTGAAGGMSALSNAAGQALKLIAFAGAIYILAQALKVFNEVEWSSLVKGGIAIIGFGLALEMVGPILDSFSVEATAAIPAMLGLGAAILMLAGGLWLMGQVPIANLIVGLLGIVGVLLAFSVLAPLLTMGVWVLLAFGAAMLMIGGAIAIAALGFSVLVDSFTNMFSVIGSNGASLFTAGLGFLAMAAGIGVLTLSLIGLGLASFLALPGLFILGSAIDMLVGAATAIENSGGSDGLTKSIEAINGIDTTKLDALKDLSMWMALLGGTTTIKFDETLKVDGTIELSGSGGGKTDTDWIKDPIFVSKLKSLIKDSEESDRNGGKGR